MQILSFSTAFCCSELVSPSSIYPSERASIRRLRRPVGSAYPDMDSVSPLSELCANTGPARRPNKIRTAVSKVPKRAEFKPCAALLSPNERKNRRNSERTDDNRIRHFQWIHLSSRALAAGPGSGAEWRSIGRLTSLSDSLVFRGIRERFIPC